MVTPATFRQQFPEFSNPAIYEDIRINNFIAVAANLLPATRWGSLLDYGTSLYVAHKLALQQRSVLAANSGALPGAIQGVLTAKQVDKVSASYDSRSVTFEEAGQYNLTTYGIELWQLMGQIGSGGLQVDACAPNPIYGPGVFGNGVY